MFLFDTMFTIIGLCDWIKRKVNFDNFVDLAESGKPINNYHNS